MKARRERKNIKKIEVTIKTKFPDHHPHRMRQMYYTTESTVGQFWKLNEIVRGNSRFHLQPR